MSTGSEVCTSAYGHSHQAFCKSPGSGHRVAPGDMSFHHTTHSTWLCLHHQTLHLNNPQPLYANCDTDAKQYPSKSHHGLSDLPMHQKNSCRDPDFDAS